jgi:hypothetical protein
VSKRRHREFPPKVHRPTVIGPARPAAGMSTEERLAAVQRGMEKGGLSLERLGHLVAGMAHGVALDENLERREGVVVADRTQNQALRLAAELQGVVVRKQETKTEDVKRIRLERAAVGTGDVFGIPGEVLRSLSAAARDEIIQQAIEREPSLALADSTRA